MIVISTAASKYPSWGQRTSCRTREGENDSFKSFFERQPQKLPRIQPTFSNHAQAARKLIIEQQPFGLGTLLHLLGAVRIWSQSRERASVVVSALRIMLLFIGLSWGTARAATLFRYGLDDALRCPGSNDPCELVSGDLEQLTKLRFGAFPPSVHH